MPFCNSTFEPLLQKSQDVGFLCCCCFVFSDPLCQHSHSVREMTTCECTYRKDVNSLGFRTPFLPHVTWVSSWEFISLPFPLLKSGRDPSLHKKQLSKYYNIRTWRKNKRKSTVNLFKKHQQDQCWWSGWMFVPNFALPAIPKAASISSTLWLMRVL